MRPRSPRSIGRLRPRQRRFLLTALPGQWLCVVHVSGGRSKFAAELLVKEGFENVSNMKGGFGGQRDRLHPLIEPVNLLCKSKRRSTQINPMLLTSGDTGGLNQAKKIREAFPNRKV
jgi:hypothetical protein